MSYLDWVGERYAVSVYGVGNVYPLAAQTQPWLPQRLPVKYTLGCSLCRFRVDMFGFNSLFV